MADKVKRLSRALQERTDWPYMECRRCVEARMPDDDLEKLISDRAAGRVPTPQRRER